MEVPRCTKCGNPMKLRRHAEYGDLAADCISCKTTIYPLPKLSKAEDKRVSADEQQGEIENLIRREGLPCPRRKR